MKQSKGDIRIKKVCGIKRKDEIARMHSHCFLGYEIYETDTGYWWVAYDGNKPAAFGGVSQSSKWSDTGYLCRSGVLPPYRGLGLQKRLIRVRLAYAKKLGWNYIVTDTRDNPASSNSLISCGFKLFEPTTKWAFKDSLYWKKKLYE